MKSEMDELLKRPMLDGQNFTIDDENAAFMILENRKGIEKFKRDLRVFKRKCMRLS